MRIIYAAEIDFSILGGHVTHIIQFVSAMRKLGNEVLIVVPNLGRYNGNANLPITYLPCIKFRFLAFITFEIALFFYLAFLRYMKGFDAIYVRSELYSLGATLHKMLFRNPLVMEINSLKVEELKRYHNSAIVRVVVDQIQRINLRHAHKIVCTAKAIVTSILQQYQVDHRKVRYVPNAADIETFRPHGRQEARAKVRLKIEPEQRVVGFVGNISEWQGLEYLVDAAKIIVDDIPNTAFLIVGDGSMKTRVEKKVATMGLSSYFHFTGKVDYHLVPYYMSTFDVGVIPRGKGIVGEPIKMFEYMSCGTPIVASDLEGFEIIEKENIGRLSAPEQPNDLARKIVSLLNNNAIRKEMANNGRKLAQEKYNWTFVARQVLQIIAESTS